MNYYARRIVLVSIQLFVVAIYSGCTNERQNDQTPLSSEVIGKQRNTGASESTIRSGVVAESAILSSIENLRVSNQGVETHMPQDDIVFSEYGRGVAYVEAQGDRQRVVHNGKPGNYYSDISRLAISPDGQRVSYRCTVAGKQQMVTDGIARLLFDNVRDQVYSRDSRHLAYFAAIGNKMRIILDEKTIEEGSEFYYGLYFTNNSEKLGYFIRSEGGHSARQVILDLKSGNKTVKECLDIPSSLNRETNSVAVGIREEGKQRVIAFAASTPENVYKSGLYNVVHEISIGVDGRSVAFVADKGKSRYLVLNNKEERLPDEMAINAPPVIRPDLKGAVIILTTMERQNRRFVLHQAFYRDGIKNKRYAQIKELVYSKVNSTSAYVANEGEKWFVVIDGKEGPAFDMIITPVFSPDGRKLVYRARTGGKRFVVVADVAGKEHLRHPEYEMVFQTVFTADGRSVAYGVKEGNKLIWKVEKL